VPTDHVPDGAPTRDAAPDAVHEDPALRGRASEDAVLGSPASADVTGGGGMALNDTDTDNTGTDNADTDSADTDSADTAAASALARARESARAKGLRPGNQPLRRRRGPPGSSSTDLNKSLPGGRDGRDPALLGDQMDRLLLDRGWNVDVAVGSVMGRWPAIVGADVAAHCTPVTFSDGILVVRAESTAWATQLRLMSSSILGRLETEVGKGAVTELRVQGPSAPSWSRGLRKSTGPGPRDTYG
jgi:predicted nucleic acid-binding Zn ribbon protein